MATTVDADIPATGAVFTFGKSKFADNLPNKFWVKNDRVLQVACGDEHTALIAESGRVFMFGPNEWGQLGLGQDNKGVNKPSCVKSLKHEKSKHVACGRSHTLISTETGYIYSFGSHADGQLGYKISTDQHVPKRIESLPPTKYKMLSAGSDSSVALTDDGKVYLWGNNEDGKLGLGEVEIVDEPTQLSMDRPVICVACGYYHTALVTDDGKLFTMGESDGGKLGLTEDMSETNVPQLVTGISEPVRWVSCGSTHTVVLTESGQCYVFGEGESGQLGLGTDILSVNKPTHLKLPFKVKKVYCGQAFTALISEKGQLYTFGDGRHGKLAHGDDQFSNQFKPYHCTRFSQFIVTKAACGGCHMIVTAKPKPHDNGDIIIDGEIDEMKSLEDKSLTETIIDGSPTLSRTLSAREKRRNEVTRSFSTLTDLPALNRSSLSTTMPALRSSHHKLNGDVLSKTVATELANQKGNKTEKNEEKSKVDHEKNSPIKDNTPTASPRGILQSPQNIRQVEDGNDEDGEGILSDETEDEHHNEDNESDDEAKDLLALSAELQKNIEEDDSDNDKSASRSDPKSLTHINSNELHKNENHINQTANESTHNEPKLEEEKEKKDVNETAVDHIDDASPRHKKGPLPTPRKKNEQIKENETAENTEEEDEEEKKEDEIKEKEDIDHAKKDGKDKKKNKDKKDKEKGKPEKGKKDKKLEEKSKEDSKSKKGKEKEKEDKEKKEKNGTEEEESKKDKKKKEADNSKKNIKGKKEENDEDEEEVKEQNDKKNNKNKKKQAEEKDAKSKTKSKKGEEDEEKDEDEKQVDEKDENANKKPPAKKSRLCTIL